MLNQEHSVIICKICRVIVLKKSLQRHLSTIHHRVKVSKDRLFLQELPNWNTIPSIFLDSRNRSTLRPVEGLDIFNGFRCPDCNFCCKKESSMKKHIKESACCFTYANANVQRVSAGLPLRYIAVSNPTVDATNSALGAISGRNEELIDFYSNARLLSSDDVNTEDTRLLSGFDAEARWTEFLNRFEEDKVLSATGMPKADDDFFFLKTLSLLTFSTLHDLLRDVRHEVRALFVNEPGENMFRPLQEFSSVQQYAALLCKLCAFSIRLTINPNLLPGFQYPEEISQAASRLATERTENSLIDFMLSIITQKMTTFGNRRESYLYNFANLAIKVASEPIDVVTVPQLVTKLKYLCRLFIFSKLFYALNDISERQSLLHWIRFDENTSFGFLSSISKWSSTHIHNKDPPQIVKWVDKKKFTSLIYKGFQVSLKDFKLAYERSLRSANTIFKALLLEVGIPKLKVEDFLEDETSKSTIGYCFMELKPSLKYTLGEKLDQFKDDNGNLDSKKSRKYLDKIEDFLEELLFLIHISSGQPARATELKGYKFRNDANGLLFNRLTFSRSKKYFRL
jgi:hypothetical protein